MFFFPYRIDTQLKGFPIVTLLICILCCYVYWQQYSADNRYFDAINQFCEHELSKREAGWVDRLPAISDRDDCGSKLESIRKTEDAQTEIKRLARAVKPIELFTSKKRNLQYLEKQYTEIYAKFDQKVPQHLTAKLAYHPHDLDLTRMVTSTFSHGGIFHLIGNLSFFYIFAASVEIIFGSLAFVLFISVGTFGTSLAYSYVMDGVSNALPTVGLSGVVMSALVALAIMMPTARIRCFLWFLIFFKRFRLPALIIAAWYLGWDIYEINNMGDESYINYAAHISGGAIGGIFGLYFLIFRRPRLKEARRTL
ncbi:MAG: membrane associated rhomboid family serine protease [Gammaproteobacteria bacterium]|jgi:membrane associated rhomboid family serine protease